MKRTLYTLVFLVIAQSLLACSGHVAHQTRYDRTMVSTSHSIYIEGGVLKVFSDEEQNILHIYVRPEVLDRWVAAGGGGGKQDNPWQHKSSMFWALGDEDGSFYRNAPRKAFNCLFDSQRMTLTVATGTYAVRRGDFVVIALDENWQPAVVSSGIESLRVFDLPENNRDRLISQAHRHYHDS